MATIKIKPSFNRIRNAVTFNTRELNYLMEEQVYDNFDFYQQTFGLYSFMRLTKDLKHIIHWMESLPFIWQPHKSCRITPLGNVTMASEAIEPCKAVALSKHCHDTLFNSCFSHFLEWDGRGPLKLSSEGSRLTARLIQKILMSFIEGARLTLTVGQLYDFSKLKAQGLLGQASKMDNLSMMFQKTMGTCKGWIETQAAKAKMVGYEHLNHPSIMSASHFSGTKFTGDIFELCKRTYEVAPADLQSVVDEGGISQAVGSNIQPFWHASTYIFKAIAERYREQCENPLCKNPRLTAKDYTWRGRPFTVYFIDNMPVIPLHAMNKYDRYLDVNTHYFALNITGNINLGASFNNIPTQENNAVGVRIKMSDDNENFGETSVRSDSLFSTAISNAEFMAGRILQITKAK